MMEPGSHTVRSHGVTVARTHMHDWLILILLVPIYVILNRIDPFHRFVGKAMMDDLKYPLKDNTVPPWTVPIYAILLPTAIFLFFYFRRRDVYDLHHAILGLLYSVFLTAVITNSVKDAVGRHRPDFFWRCFPDGKEVYDQWGDVICHGEKNVVKEGYKSFPSGHTSDVSEVGIRVGVEGNEKVIEVVEEEDSNPFEKKARKCTSTIWNDFEDVTLLDGSKKSQWSFAGLGFLSLYISGKIKPFDRRGHVAKLCIVFLPLLIASLVGISRVDDYWHHWEDVFAGGLLGLTVATFCYLQFFPPPYHVEGWGPYAYFRVLEEIRTSTQAANNVNMQNVQPREAHMESPQHERSSNAFIGISLAGDTSSSPEDLESGRRESFVMDKASGLSCNIGSFDLLRLEMMIFFHHLIMAAQIEFQTLPTLLEAFSLILPKRQVSLSQ
ncbi:hypothetical protein RHGRI_028807 [Rhododendron griersonianum]|uniref:Phosphatidic acid phosphatase type 2/haloperoxidase domain-containing protein n=1 Tax=Rhododendron griersonianum TaxID=479676 RepID=A0AAV6IJ40_9ERIC|nr:hypothetical protein RHGRI_028807 [Rhododendron griersonianum]KAG5527997.1 hypothetical protein RHGRI_028807 [Rhododendron griersonianum]KAG5528000.1 hypothetical protein RHGRI_028807 [Rhododendron griersonianum]